MARTVGLLNETQVLFPLTLRRMRGEGWSYLDLEINTPVLRYCPKALEQLEKVLKAVIAKFNDGTNWQFYANKTCGLHVHVGKQARAEDKMTNAGHPFFVTRNLLTLVAFFEKQINTVFPPSRIEGQYAIPLSSSMRAKRNTYGIAEAIETSRGYRELADVMGAYIFATYNIQPLLCMDYTDRVDGSSFKTFEFRQHHGSVDSDDILSWVRFVCGLVRLCHRAGEVGFPGSFLRRHNQGLGFLELLDFLNMSALKEHYKKPGKLFEHLDTLPWEAAPGVLIPDDNRAEDSKLEVVDDHFEPNEEDRIAFGPPTLAAHISIGRSRDTSFGSDCCRGRCQY